MTTMIIDAATMAKTTLFTGSSDEDKACAKLFWQSVTLHPTIESRLVSGDIRQRLPTAPQPGQPVNASYKVQEIDPKLEAHLRKAHEQTIFEESKKLTNQALKREANIALLMKRKKERIEKEMLSKQRREPSQFNLTGEIDEDLNDNDDDEFARTAMKELDAFDKAMMSSKH